MAGGIDSAAGGGRMQSRRDTSPKPDTKNVEWKFKNMIQASSSPTLSCNNLHQNKN